VSKLIVMVGVPGSGKTTLAKKLVEKGFHYLNADAIRLELYGSEAEQGDNEQVFSIFFERLEVALGGGLDIVIDNTNINMRQRKPILERAERFSYSDIQLWLLDIPLELCLRRNASRERIVPAEIVSNMFATLNRSGRPQRTEGRLVIIRPGPDENEFRFFFPPV
jgi:predicted kinase